jgi:hypothetical protein
MDRSANPAGQIPVYFYEIDPEDRIVAASDSWDTFALENDGDHLVFDKVHGDLIWEHIDDDETVGLYRRIFAAARKGKPVQFFLRCDSPTVRRMLSVLVAPAEVEGNLRVTTLLFRSDQRDAQDLRAKRSESAAMKVPACSWCEKVLIPEQDWQEVEHASEWLKSADLPGKCSISYTVCPECRQQIELQLRLAGG